MAEYKGVKDTGKTLRIDQETFFLLGYTWDFMGDKKFPFRSEKNRREIWERYRKRILDLMHLPRTDEIFSNGFRIPSGNSLRPHEWWIREAPEPKRELETDCEALTRLGLITDEDRRYMETEWFKKPEEYALSYRKYIESETQKAELKRKEKAEADIVVKNTEKIPEQVIKPQVKFPVPIVKKEINFTDLLDGVMVGGDVVRPVKIVSGVCPRCQKPRKTEFCKICGCKIP